MSFIGSVKVARGVFENWSAGVSIPTFRQEEASVGKRLSSISARGYQLGTEAKPSN